MGVRRSLYVWGAALALLGLLMPGCGFGPRHVHSTRLPYNEAVKSTGEEQLLLNIVRLRYSDNPSSLAVSTIAAQFELIKKLQLVPFFTSAAAGNAFGGYRSALLPAAEMDSADRPTLSYTPQDETDFARRLFTPLTLDGIVYLAKTTWPFATVFRLYLENLNWVPNAQTISGPTPKDPPEYEEFLRGILALQRLQDANKVAILAEEREERIGSSIRAAQVTPRDLIEAAKANFELKREDEIEGAAPDKGKDKDDGKDGDVARSSDGWRPVRHEQNDPEKLPPPLREADNKKPAARETTWALIKKEETPYLYVSADVRSSPDWLEFCRVFEIDPSKRKLEIGVTEVPPFQPRRRRPDHLDLETRSLLQVLFFVSHGVEVPPEHFAAGLARATADRDGSVFDYQRVLGGLFQVKSVKCKNRPENAAVAVHYLDRWYYVDATDHDTRATFALLVHLSRLEIGGKAGPAPVLTIPLGGR